MNQNKKSLRVNFLDAVKNYKEKKFKNAEIICFKILSIDSNYTDALILLGTISAVNRNFEKAKLLSSQGIESIKFEAKNFIDKNFTLENVVKKETKILKELING